MATSSYTKLIRISLCVHEDAHFTLTSEDLPEMFLAGKDVRQLLDDAPNVIKGLYRLNYGMDVEVFVKDGATCSDDTTSTWELPPIFALNPLQECGAT